MKQEKLRKGTFPKLGKAIVTFEWEDAKNLFVK